MTTAAQKVSFTVRRPTPVSRTASSGADSDSGAFKVPSLPRHLANTNDSTPGSPLARSTTASPKQDDVYHNGELASSDEDEDDRFQDELVTGFDRFGVQRCVSVSSIFSQSCQLTKGTYDHSFPSLHRDKKPKQGPLVIPALENRDWRALARKRRSGTQYVPASAKAEIGKDGSVGGLGVKDTINSGPVLSGLQVKKRENGLKREEDVMDEEVLKSREDVKMEEPEETEDQKALRAILSGTSGNDGDGLMIDVIPTPISEADAYKQDVEELPDVATLEDYARVPVSQFGAALLRGMGWKEGMAASRKPGKGLVEPYLPESRPALLGIGAKEREALDDGSKKRGGAGKRPERRYVPLIKKDRDDSGSGSGGRERRERSRSPRRGSGSAMVSRRGSRSPGRSRDYDDRQKDNSRRDRDRDSRRRDSEKDVRRPDSERNRSDRRRDYEESSRRKRDY